MRQIAQKTGIGLNTVYMHHGSKERLLFSFINEWIRRLDNQLVEHLKGLEDVKERIKTRGISQREEKILSFSFDYNQGSRIQIQLFCHLPG